MTFRRIFDKKLQAGETIFQNEGDLNIHEQPFPTHDNDRGKGQVIDVSTSDRDVGGDLPM